MDSRNKYIQLIDLLLNITDKNYFRCYILV